MTYADLAAAAHLSAADYLGDVPWKEDETAKGWYARIKSRPSFRTLLTETLAGPRAVGKLRQSRLLESGGAQDALAADARTQGFDVVGVARPDAIPLAPERLRAVSRRRRARRHGVDGRQRRTARRSARAVAAGALRSSCSASTTDRNVDPLAILKERTRGAISVYARGDDYHDVMKPRLKAIGRWLIEQAGGDVKVFVDTAPVMEKPLAAAAGLGWQGKHTNLVSRELGSWLFPRRDLHHARSAARCARGRSLRQLPRLSRHLPDRGVPGALSARCTALHLLPHHRAQGTDRPRAAAAHGQPHLWLRRLPGGLSLEQIRAGRPRGEARGARGSAGAAACRACAARRCARSARCSPRVAGQAHRRARAFLRNVLIAIGNSGDTALAPEAERLLDDFRATHSRRRHLGARPVGALATC